MTCIYLDSSALLRILFVEKGPRAPLVKASVVVSSELLAVEAQRVFDRARLDGQLDDLTLARKTRELRKLLGNMHLFPLGTEMLELAATSFPVRCRAVDSLHVATAQLIERETGKLEFWTHDAQLAAAAAVRGLDVRGLELNG